MAGHVQTWAVIGASRGIGHEFVEQLLADGHTVIATVRKATLQNNAELWPNTNCQVYECDLLSERSIDTFARRLKRDAVDRIDYLVLNAGVLKYPNRATEISYEDFVLHLHTNTIGPIVCAQRLLKTGVSIGSVTFVSSDSGSAQQFRAFEDGLAAYAASKAALNQMLRHMAAELRRNGSETIVLALHPGEVKTAMADNVGWDIEGQMTAAESVKACVQVITSKTKDDSGSFWTWQNETYPW